MRNIYLSQSAIKDFIACSQRYYYRVNFPEESEQTDVMVIGNVIHGALEKAWDNELEAIRIADTLMEYYGLAISYTDTIYEMIDNYFKKYKILTSEGDLVEHNFKVPFDDNVFIVGKFDRINKGSNLLLDWKTGKVPYLNTMSKDVQSIIYYNSYKQLFGSFPTMVYVFLKENKLITYNPVEIYAKVLYEDIIPNLITSVQKGLFSHEGLYTTACKNCAFMNICYKGLGIEK